MGDADDREMNADARHRFVDSEIWHSFRASPVAMLAAAIAAACLLCAVLAPLVAPHDPFDLATLNLGDSRLPPAWMAEGKSAYLLGQLAEMQHLDAVALSWYGQVDDDDPHAFDAELRSAVLLQKQGKSDAAH